MNALSVPPRRGLPVAVAVAAALVLTEAGRWREWLGSWPETQHHVGVGFVLALPAAVAAGGWLGASHVQSGLADLGQTAAVSAARVAAREIGETACWAVAGYLAGALPAYAATAVVSVNGHPGLLPVLAHASCAAGAAAVGFWLGTAVPSRVTAPVAGVVAYVVLGFVSFRAEDALVVLTPIDARSMTFHRIVPWALALQALAWALVAAQSVAWRAGGSRAAFACLFVAGLASVPLLLTTPRTWVADTAAAGISCVGFDEQVLCLTRGDEVLRASLSRELMRAADRLNGLLPARTAFVDDEAEAVSPAARRQVDDAVARFAAQGYVAVRLSDLGGLGNPQLKRPEFHNGLVSGLVPPARVVADETSGTPADLIHAWYLASVGVATDGSAAPGAADLDALDFSAHRVERAWFAGLTGPQRARWFAEHRAAVADGTLAWDAFAQRSDAP